MQLLLNQDFAANETDWVDPGSVWQTVTTVSGAGATLRTSDWPDYVRAAQVSFSSYSAPFYQNVDLIARGLLATDIDAGTVTVYGSWDWSQRYPNAGTTFRLEAYDGDPSAGGALIATIHDSGQQSAPVTQTIFQYSSGGVPVPATTRFLRFITVHGSASDVNGSTLWYTSLIAGHGTINVSALRAQRIFHVSAKARISALRLQRIFNPNFVSPSTGQKRLRPLFIVSSSG